MKKKHLMRRCVQTFKWYCSSKVKNEPLYYSNFSGKSTSPHSFPNCLKPHSMFGCAGGIISYPNILKQMLNPVCNSPQS